MRLRLVLLRRLGCLSLAAALSAAAPVRADGMAEAKEHFKRGQTHYSLGEFTEAVAEFRDAYRLRDEPAILFNIAQAMRQLGQFKQAHFYYSQYLARRPEASNRADVEQFMVQMRRKADAEEQAERVRREAEAARSLAAASAAAAALPGAMPSSPASPGGPTPAVAAGAPAAASTAAAGGTVGATAPGGGPNAGPPPAAPETAAGASPAGSPADPSAGSPDADRAALGPPQGAAAVVVAPASSLAVASLPGGPSPGGPALATAGAPAATATAATAGVAAPGTAATPATVGTPGPAAPLDSLRPAPAPAWGARRLWRYSGFGAIGAGVAAEGLALLFHASAQSSADELSRRYQGGTLRPSDAALQDNVASKGRLSTVSAVTGAVLIAAGAAAVLVF